VESETVIRIAITQAAFDAIAETLLIGIRPGENRPAFAPASPAV
jgi:hypothetical protein